jgi:ubiquitin-like protein Pup
MSQRESAKAGSAKRAPEEAEAVPAASAKGSLDADVDAILDEIDGVLEENAEDFVRSFVQKGGE